MLRAKTRPEDKGENERAVAIMSTITVHIQMLQGTLNRGGKGGGVTNKTSGMPTKRTKKKRGRIIHTTVFN